MDWNALIRGGWKIFAVLGIPLFIIGLILVIHGSGGSDRSENNGGKSAALKEIPDDPSKVWRKGRIPFTIDPLLTDAKSLITNAMKLIQDKTCIQFVEKQENDLSWVNFNRDDSVCYSSKTGRNYKQSLSGQEVGLGRDCWTISKIQRALGLLLGLPYEETRPDRERYVHYNPLLPKCIERALGDSDEISGEPINNSTYFKVSNDHSEAALEIVFDYASHMFSAKECFQTYHSRFIRLGSSDGEGGALDESGSLSVLDIEKLNAVYQCSGCNSYRWIHIYTIQSHSFTSFNPIQSGFNVDGRPLYICRVYRNGSLLIGKLEIPGHYTCWVPDNRYELNSGRSFDVLTNPQFTNLTWVDHKLLTSINDAIVGGRSNSREPYYIGRCTLTMSGRKTIVSGWYLPSTGVTTVGFGHKSYECRDFEVLICKR